MTLTPRPIMGLAAPSTDIVVAPLNIVELAAKVDVATESVVLGAALELPLQLQRLLEPKSPCWAHLRVRLPMAVIPLMVLVALAMGTPFVVAGQTVLAALFTV